MGQGGEAGAKEGRSPQSFTRKFMYFSVWVGGPAWVGISKPHTPSRSHPDWDAHKQASQTDHTKGSSPVAGSNPAVVAVFVRAHNTTFSQFSHTVIAAHRYTVGTAMPGERAR